MKALVIILALVGASFLALLVYGNTQHEQPKKACSHPRAFDDDDPDPDDLSSYCPPDFAQSTRGLQARFAPGLGQDEQVVTIGSLGASLAVAPGKDVRAAKLKLVQGNFAQIRKGEDVICICAEGTPIPDSLRGECDGNWKRKHQGRSACLADFDSASMPFDEKAGSLSFAAGPPARVEVQ